MVSFTCDRCLDVVKKPKVLSHASSCGSRSFSCVDCMSIFTLDTVRHHTQCVTEEEKYQGKWKKTSTTAAASAKSRTVDSDNEDEEEKLRQEKALLRLRVRPDARNFLAGSSSSSSSDDDADNDAHAKKRKVGTTRAAAKERSPAAPAARRSPVKRSRVEETRAEAPVRERTTTPPRRHSPLLLPQSTASLHGTPAAASTTATAATVQVPAFALGSVEEVSELVHDILHCAGAQQPMSEKSVAVELVRRYEKRLAKRIRAALHAAAVDGALHGVDVDTHGIVTCRPPPASDEA